MFQRLEQCSKKQIQCDGSIEFLRLCQSFNLTPTFAKVSEDKQRKWKRSSAIFNSNVLDEELKHKIAMSTSLKTEINLIYDEIRREVSHLRYLCILQTMTNLRKKLHREVMMTHTKKISRLLNRESDIDEHILNLSSYQLSFFQKLVLCRGLQFSIPRFISPLDIKASFEKAYWQTEPKLNTDNQKELTSATLKSIATDYIQPKGKGRPPKYYHPLLKKEKTISSVVHRILPKKHCRYCLSRRIETGSSLRPPKDAQNTTRYASNFICERHLQLRVGQMVGK